MKHGYKILPSRVQPAVARSRSSIRHQAVLLSTHLPLSVFDTSHKITNSSRPTSKVPLTNLTMPLTVSPVTEEDLPIIVAIDHEAMSGTPLPLARQTLCGFPDHASYTADILANLCKNFAKRDEQDLHYYKVTDTDRSPSPNDPYKGIICFCVWKIHDTTRSPPPPPGPCRAQPLRPSNFPETGLYKYVSKMADDLRAEHFPNDSYLFFEMLMTTPANQRRGAGRLLIKRALEMADERGILVSAGQGSEDGIGLYKRCGYVPVREFLMDMRPYGVDAKPQRQWMLVRRLEAGHKGAKKDGGRLGSKL
ncbi:hypothetical protein V8F20_008666 [Naviculisporaceae sp. PSN 640]